MARMLACVFVLIAAAALPAYGAGSKPVLRLSGTSVSGAHFHARERVRVRLTSSTTITKSVRASATGTFSVALPSGDPCDAVFVITAIGATGDSAHLKVMPRACPPSNTTP